jgi:muconolactone delta-isomerase
MKCIALEQDIPGIGNEEFSRYAEAEAQKVWELIQQEKIREIYFRQDQENAVIILECRDKEEAQQILATLPFVSHGLIKFEVIELRPYPGLERLFFSSK